MEGRMDPNALERSPFERLLVILGQVLERVRNEHPLPWRIGPEENGCCCVLSADGVVVARGLSPVEACTLVAYGRAGSASANRPAAG